jgi:tripartite ATP-independent transporter DctM subunit
MYEIISVSLGFIIAVALLMGGLQIAIAIGIGAILTLLLNEGVTSLKAVGFIVWGSVNNSTLSALPLFILMAELMLRSGVSDGFYDGMSKLIRRLPGGLLQTNIASAALFSAISGSSVATAAAIGSVAIDRQKKDGYDHSMIAGSVCAGGTLGNLIPPSIVMIIYATFAELSVAKLFIASIIPGLVMTAMYMIYIAGRCMINPTLAPPMPRGDKGSVLKGFIEIGPMVGLMILILGSIYFGIATPTEAAAVGALLAAVMAAVLKRPPLSVYYESLMQTVLISAAIMLIAISTFILNYAVQTTGLTTALTKWVISLNLDVNVFLIAMFIFYILLGTIIEAIGMIVLTVPLLLPILIAYNVDLLWYGVILVVVVELALISPPVGMILFVVDHQLKEGAGPVLKGVIPYFYIFALFLMLMLFLPQMATWLPSKM